MGKNIRYVIGAVLFFGWLAVLGLQLVQEARWDDVSVTIKAGMLTNLLAYHIVGSDSRDAPGFVRWTLLAASLAAWGVSSMLKPPSQDTLIIWAGLAFAVLVLWLIRKTFQRAYQKWKTLRSPLAKIMIATAFLTVITIVAVMVLAFLLINYVDWQVMVTNWDVTLLIAFLPALFLAYWVFTKWQAGRK